MREATRLALMPPGRLENWNALKETPQGTEYEMRAAAIVLSATRPGIYVRIRQPYSAQQPFPGQGLLRRSENQPPEKSEIEEMGSGRKLERLFAKERVERTVRSLRGRQQAGAQPSIFQVLGAIALIYGTNSPELKDSATYTLSTYTHHRGNVTWQGAPINVFIAIKQDPILHQNYPTAVYGLLAAAKRPLTSRQIVQGLGMEASKIQLGNVNASLQMLETMDLVRKLPMLVDMETGKRVSVWMSREFDPPTDFYAFTSGNQTHYLNISMEVLHQLSSGEKLMRDLYKKDTDAAEGLDAVYASANVLDSCIKLKKAGFIAVNRVVKTGGMPSRLLELTPLGRDLWEQAVHTGILPEGLIGPLLGGGDKCEGAETLGPLIRIEGRPFGSKMEAQIRSSAPAAGAIA